jgi:hypothetical protein
MKANQFPPHIQSKLDELAQTTELLAEQVGKTKDAITGARQRLSGGFQSDQEFSDLRASLDQLVADQPVLGRKLRDAQFTLADCKSFLEALPSDAVLEPVAAAKLDDDLDLQSARQRIADATDEVRQLRAVPTPSPDLEREIKGYVSAFARPRVSGIASGQQLRVDWPTKDPIAVLAFLLPNEMVDALVKEVVRSGNTPPPDERKKRISELEAEIDALQRRALALGDDICVMPAPVVLGVRVSRQTKRAA